MRAALIFTTLLGIGCGTPEVGGTCKHDTDCDSELDCVNVYKIPSSGCSQAYVTSNVCSLACTTDSDCASLGGDFTCAKTYCPVPGYCAAK